MVQVWKIVRPGADKSEEILHCSLSQAGQHPEMLALPGTQKIRKWRIKMKLRELCEKIEYTCLQGSMDV